MKFNFTFMRCMAVLLACFTAFSLQAQTDVTVTITAPGSVAGDYAGRQAAFGPGVSADVSGMIVEGVDTAGLTTVCDTVANDLTGAIALVDRGACSFVAKVTNAQTKGAIAVIVCNNNTALPDQAIVMGGDDMGTVTIPAVMLTYNQCQTIRAELSNGLAGTITTSPLVPAPAGTVCSSAEVITGPGQYNTPELNAGFGAPFSGNGYFYSYTPAQNEVITVASCGVTDTVDTRVIVLDNCTDLNVLGFNDDCDPDNGLFSSEFSWLAIAGTEYIIHWDDRWEATSFDWTLSAEAPPMVDVTVTVDMRAEAVNNGAHIAGSFNGWSSVPMTDNGDTTYSFTITGVTAGDNIEYKFQNGENINWEEFADGDPCTITDDSGNFVNRLLVPGLENSSLPIVCFNSCEACPPPACSDPDAIICDDFEDYTVDLISAQSSNWAPWGGTAGAGDDATVSTDFAASGTQSLLVSAANGDDMLLLLGDQTSGNWSLSWKMYVPAGSTGYFNTQKIQDSPGEEFGMQVEFFADGTSTLDAGAADVVTYNWDADTWMDLSLEVDLDNDWMIYSVNGVEIYSWPASWGTFAQSGTLQLGAVNFFGNTGTTQYIDDVLFKTLPANPTCDAPAFVIQDDIESYELGDINGAAPQWGVWTGATSSGIVTEEFAASGTKSVKIDGSIAGQDALLFLNDAGSGHYWVGWKMYVPAENNAYFNLQHDPTPGAAFGFECQMIDGTGTVLLNNQDDVTFTYPEGEWFDVILFFDINNDEARMIIGDIEVYASLEAAWGYTDDSTDPLLSAINLYPIDATYVYYVDDVALAQLPDAQIGQYCYTAESASLGVNTVPEAKCFGGGYQVDNNSSHAGNEGLGGYWFTFTPPANGIMTLSSCGGGADTRGWIFQGDCRNLATVGVNDDQCDLGDGNNWASYRETVVEGGTTYYILWDDIWDQTGFDFEISFTPASGDDGLFCQTAIPVTTNVDILAENFGFAAVTGGFVDNSSASSPTAYAQTAWYSFTPTVADTVDLTSCDATSDTRVWVYTGSCGTFDDLTLIASSDDGCDAGLGSLIEDWVVEAGVTYYIEWDDHLSSDPFLWRIEGAPSVNVDEIDLNSGISVFPNPATDLLNVQFDLDEAVDMQVRLINTLGQTVMVKELNNVQGETINFNVSNLAVGTYYVQFITENASTSQKVILQE